jgi:YegS/Rv2252/BmrU family lipid kinase
MNVKIIVNPYANRWNAGKKIPLIEKAFAQAGVQFDLVTTEEPFQATTEAEAAAGRYDAVIAAGGDGTVNEVVNGLVKVSGPAVTCPLGVLSIGTGNDFSDMAQLPREIDAVARLVAAGKTRQVDIGVVNGHYFDNNCALAMEPLVTIENVKIKRLSGPMRYMLALIKALMKLQAWEMQIAWDDGQYTGPIYLLSVCNGPRTGAMFHMAPAAAIDDGLFDVILAPSMSKLEVLSILPKLLNGSHIQHPKVTHFRTSQLTVHSQPGTPIHADGEVLTDSAETITYSLLPGKLTLLTP